MRVADDAALVATVPAGQADDVLDDDISRLALLAHRHLQPAAGTPK